MGFLTMAYGKLNAGRNYRSIQSRLMNVQRRLQRMTKDIGEQQKALEKQKTQTLNSIKNAINVATTASSSIFGAVGMSNFTNMFGSGNISQMYSSLSDNAAFKQAFTDNGGKNISSLGTANASAEDMKAASAAISGIQQAQTYSTQLIQQLGQQILSQVENNFDAYMDAQLQPLKDEEEELTLEKENLESQLEIAKQDYQACKDAEKSDAQMLKPNYGGQ